MTTCAGCRKTISGAFIKALDQSWHEGCFRCAACRRPIGKERYLERDRQPYHAACYHERFSPRCAGCQQPITGNYTTALGKSWHSEHFVCERCRRPFEGRSFYERDGKAYCENDYHELFSPRCAICNQPMRERYLVNAWDEHFCARHKEELPACFSCGRLVSPRLTGGGVRYQDGRTMCNRCRRTAIDDARAAHRILRDVRAGLSTSGVEPISAEITVRLADQQELNRLRRRDQGVDPAGMARTRLTTRDGEVVDRQVEEILVLHGLPREHTAAVLAHEFGHAWLFLRAFPELPPRVEEGICELFQSLWLERQGTPEAAYRLKLMEENDDPVYGTGYRAARGALRGRSLAQLLAHVRQHRRFPS